MPIARGWALAGGPIAGSCLFALSCLCLAPAARAGEPGPQAPPGGAAAAPSVPARTAPVLLQRVEPVYPPAARAKGIGGDVGLEIAVDAQGNVSSVKVTHPAGFGLDEAAVAAARRFRFGPATENGKPIASIVLFDQRFEVRPHLTADASVAPSPPAAEETPVPSEPYTTTAVTRGPRSAASATSIRNEDFELRPHTSPNDLLRVVPGLLAVQHQGGGKADQLFLRGFDADHGTDVGVFIDGVPVNLPTHAHGQGFADLHFLIPEAIERIDVEKGPYDVRYGDFSTAGAINLVTRKQFTESSVGYTLESYPTLGTGKLAAGHRVLGIVGKDLLGGRLHPWIAFEGAESDGQFVNPLDLSRWNLFAKISFDATPRDTLGAFLSAYGSGWRGSGQIPSRLVDSGQLDQFDALDPSEGGLTERQMVTAFYKHKDPKNVVTATVYFTRYKLSLWNDFTFFLNDPVLGDEIEQDDDRTVTGGTLSWTMHGFWRGISFHTTLGAQVRYDSIHLELWHDTSQDGVYRKRIEPLVTPGTFTFGNNDDVGQEDLAGYAEEDVVFNRWVRAIAGVRADYFGFNVQDHSEATGAANATVQPTSGVKQAAIVNPKATVVITPWRPLDLYLNFGMGFHSNDARLAVQDGLTTASGAVANTLPRFYGGELGTRLTLWHDRLSVAAALWASYLENESVFDADTATFEPADPTRRYGVDAELRLRILDWLYLDFDLSQAVPEKIPPNAPPAGLALAPRLYMTGGLTAKKHFGIQDQSVRAGLRFRYLGSAPAFDTDSPEYTMYNATDPDRVNTRGWFVVDLYAAYRIRFVEISTSIQNLLDTDWREAQFGNESCTRDETTNPANPNYSLCGAALASRPGVADVHFTPGVPFNLDTSVKVYF